MRTITKSLITDFETTNFDWVGFKVSKKNPFSFHHIEKKEHGGLYLYSNGAILCGGKGGSHEELHLIEMVDPELYIYMNNLLKNINTQGYKPSLNQLRAARAILEQFEREHCSDLNSKGAYLIKPSYYEKRIHL